MIGKEKKAHLHQREGKNLCMLNKTVKPSPGNERRACEEKKKKRKFLIKKSAFF